MSQETLNRRTFFKRAAVLGASAAGAGLLLSACKQDGGDAGAASGADDKAAAEGSADKPSSAELVCDTSGLSDSDKQNRAAQAYVDKSTNPEQNCANCALYTEPTTPGTCGGCTVVKGPIHPDGWCKVWAPKPS